MEPDCFERCLAKYNEISEHNGLRNVFNVKKILMEHLEDVMEGAEQAKELKNSDVGDNIDAQITQENIECENIGLQEHPSYKVLYHENLSVSNDTP